MNASIPVALGSVALCVVSVARWRGAKLVTLDRALRLAITMLVASSWRETGWMVWALFALGMALFDAAHSEDGERAFLPVALGSALAVSWNALRFGAPPMRVAGMVVVIAVGVAIARGRAVKPRAARAPS